MKNRIRKIYVVTLLCMLVAVLAKPESVSAATAKLSAKSMTVRTGNMEGLSLKGVSEKAKVKWSVSDSSVVSIEGIGTTCALQGHKAGTATITAKVGKKTLTCKVKVIAAKLSTSKETSYIGCKWNLYIRNTTATPKVTVSNNKIIKVAKRYKNNKYIYKVTPLKKGKATIKVKLGAKTYKCAVTVKADPTWRTRPHVSTSSGIVTSDDVIYKSALGDVENINKGALSISLGGQKFNTWRTKSNSIRIDALRDRYLTNKDLKNNKYRSTTTDTWELTSEKSSLEDITYKLLKGSSITLNTEYGSRGNYAYYVRATVTAKSGKTGKNIIGVYYKGKLLKVTRVWVYSKSDLTKDEIKTFAD